jgi:hypothetical protein
MVVSHLSEAFVVGVIRLIRCPLQQINRLITQLTRRRFSAEIESNISHLQNFTEICASDFP